MGYKVTIDGVTYDYAGSNEQVDNFRRADVAFQENARDIKLLQDQIDSAKAQGNRALASQLRNQQTKALQAGNTIVTARNNAVEQLQSQGTLSKVATPPINPALSSDAAVDGNKTTNPPEQIPLEDGPPLPGAVDSNANTRILREDLPPPGADSQTDSGVSDDRAPSQFAGGGEIPQPGSFTAEISTAENRLAKYNSYSYEIAFYMLSDDQYRRLIGSGNKSTNGFSAIVKSGGIAGDRNPNFPLDLFIDDVEIEHLLPQLMGQSGMNTKINFKIIEPYGFTFIQSLKAASEQLNGVSNWIQQHYLLTIKWYGYDQSGERIADSEEFSKFIPMRLTNITTTANTGSPTYEVSALSAGYEGQGQMRATIPFNIELSGQTLEELFNGGIEFTDDGGIGIGDIALDAVDVAMTGGREIELERIRRKSQKDTTKTLKRGLIPHLNKLHKDLVKKGKQDFNDAFKVTFDRLSKMGEQKVILPGKTKKERTPMNEKSERDLLNLGGFNKDGTTFTVNAGIQLTMFLSLMIQNSEYITKQQTAIIDKVDGTTVKQEGNPVLSWFNIDSRITPQKFDTRRNTWAYAMEYICQPRKVYDVRSPFFNKADFQGTHKTYRYWFTGENTEVIDYELNFNALYFNTFGIDDVPEPPKLGATGASSSLQPYALQAEGEGASQGSQGDAGDPAARAAGVLYSPVDYAKVSLEIYGDPDWIPQGGVLFRPGQDFSAFYPQDGSINYHAMEALFSIGFRRIVDYDENTGEAATLSAGLKTAAQESASGEDLIYRAIKATSVFSKGQFTQELEGLLMDFPTSDTQAVENVTFSNLSALSGDNYLNARGIGVVDKSRESRSQSPNPFIEGYSAPTNDRTREVENNSYIFNPNTTETLTAFGPIGGIQYFDPTTNRWVETDVPNINVEGPIDP